MHGLHKQLHAERLTGSMAEFSPAEATQNCSFVWWVPLAVAAIGAIGNVVAAKEGAKGQKAAAAALQPSIDAANAARSFAAAAADPTDPRNVNLTRLLEEAMRENVLKGMREALAVDRRLTRRSGRAAVFVNPERRDEARSRSIMELFLEAGSRARDEASRRLLAAASGLSGSANALSGPVRTLAEIQLAKGAAGSALVEGQTSVLGGLISNPQIADKIGGLFSGGATTSDPTTDNIMANFTAGEAGGFEGF